MVFNGITHYIVRKNFSGLYNMSLFKAGTHTGYYP